MAKTSTLTITMSVVGDGINEQVGVAPQTLLQYTNTAAPGGVPQPLVLALGFNAVAVPAGASWFIYQPPAASIVAKTLKGITGDTGIVMHLTNPTIIPIGTGVTTVGITTLVSGETGSVYWL